MQTRWSSASTFRLPIPLEGRCRRPSRIHPLVAPAAHVAASRGKTASASPCSAAAQLVRRDRRAHSMLRGRRGGRGRVRRFRMACRFKIQNAPSHLALPTKSKNDGRSVLHRPIVPCCSVSGNSATITDHHHGRRAAGQWARSLGVRRCVP